jgi:hypothetical protein
MIAIISGFTKSSNQLNKVSTQMIRQKPSFSSHYFLHPKQQLQMQLAV